MGNRGLAEAINSIVSDMKQNQSGSMDETFYIDVEEILDNHGAIMAYRDIVDRKKGFGSMAKVYTMLVHPVIAELFNEAVNCDDDGMADNLREMVNTRTNDAVGDFIYDSITNKIREYIECNNRLMDVGTETIAVFAISMLELLVSHVRNYALDFRDRIAEEELDDMPGYVLLNPKASAGLEPDVNNPTMLRITITYTWVNLA